MRFFEYRRKRRPGAGQRGRTRHTTGNRPCFVIQQRAADGGHYDLCLEIGGLLVSWAIPTGPSTRPRDRRLVRRVENHPLEYAASDAIAGDRGTYANATRYEMGECLERGHLSFCLCGEKLRGCYALTRIREGEKETWLLRKLKEHTERQGEDTDPRGTPALTIETPGELDNLP